MESRAKLFGHAIHPVLIVFPLGLLATSFIFDIIRLLTGNLRTAPAHATESDPAHDLGADRW